VLTTSPTSFVHPAYTTGDWSIARVFAAATMESHSASERNPSTTKTSGEAWS
jgi:hypothetical protein